MWTVPALLCMTTVAALLAAGLPYQSEGALPKSVSDSKIEEGSAVAPAEGCAPSCAGHTLILPKYLQADPAKNLGAGFTIISPGVTGAEPTLGVDSSGNELYVQYGLFMARTLNGGTSWTMIQPLAGSLVSLDPMMYYDPAIDRVYINHLTVACTRMAWHDNPSAATSLSLGWRYNPHACGLPGLDHQKLEGGPSPLLGIANGGRSLYLGYSQAGGGAMVAKSVDGGIVWTTHVAMASALRGTVLWPTGPVTADPAGTYVYMAMHNPSNGLWVARSIDEGLTYTPRQAFLSSGANGHAVDPEVAVDSAGTAYVVWWDRNDKQVYYQYSTDHGFTWSARVQVSSSPILSTVFPAAIARSPGKLDVAFYATRDSNLGPDSCPQTGSSRCRWYVHMAQITSADTATPTITMTQVTPDSDPIQIGRICTGGTSCPSGTRNLLDFIDIKVDGSGYAHIAYTDGCVGSCGPTTSGQTTADEGRYARQTTGSTI